MEGRDETWMNYNISNLSRRMELFLSFVDLTSHWDVFIFLSSLFCGFLTEWLKGNFEEGCHTCMGGLDGSLLPAQQAHLEFHPEKETAGYHHHRCLLNYCSALTTYGVTMSNQHQLFLIHSTLPVWMSDCGLLTSVYIMSASCWTALSPKQTALGS